MFVPCVRVFARRLGALEPGVECADLGALGWDPLHGVRVLVQRGLGVVDGCGRYGLLGDLVVHLSPSVGGR